MEPSVEAANERVGSTLRGKWHLVRLLGIGGMAAVYEGRHRNGMRGAVKVLDRELAKAPDFRERFAREGRIANDVGHMGVVQVLDDDEMEDGSAFLVMELLEGTTLDILAMKRGGRLRGDELARHAAQVLDTLAAVHERGILHRDIKPENLFLTDGGVVKLLDFGIATSHSLAAAPRVTLSGQPIGTPAFMSPEQARGQWDSVDARTDIYALGATMFTLATGEMVHDAPTVAELLVSVMKHPAKPVRQVADVPAALAAVIDCALAYDKRSRFENAALMRSALERAHREMTGKPIPSTPSAVRLPRARDVAAVTADFRARLAKTHATRLRWPRLVGAAVTSALLLVGMGVLGAAAHARSRTTTDHRVALAPAFARVPTTHVDALPAIDMPPPAPAESTSTHPHSRTRPLVAAASRRGPLFQHRY